MSSLNDRLSEMSPEKRALLAMRLQQKTRQAQAEVTIPREPELVEAPLSYAQERFWFLQRFDPSPVYNDRLACRLSGPLDREALRASLEEIVRRHAVLRSTIQETEEGPVQRIAPPERLELPRLDLSGIPASVREPATVGAVAASTGVVFDLERTPAFRVLLVDLGEDVHVLAVTLHHVVTDGWSWQVFLRELAAIYQAFSQDRPSPLPKLPIQYGDFARWQRRNLVGEALERQLAYWRDRIAGMPPVLDLPLDRPRPAKQTYSGAVRSFAPPARVVAGIRELARRQGATPFMVLLTAFQALLRRSCRQDDIAVGSPILGRSRPETEPLIGVFINTLVFRSRIIGDPTFVETLATVRQVALEAYAHQDLPFEKLVEALDPERNLSHAPLVQVTFGLQGAAPAMPPLASLEITPLAIEHRTTRYDLGLELEESPDGGLNGRFQYNSDLFNPDSIERLCRHLEALLEAIVADPDRRLSELPWLTAAEHQQLVREWNDTAAEAEPGLLHERIFFRASRCPEAVAVTFRGRCLTYGELALRAGALARRLRRLGVGPEERVGVALARSPELVIALLAVLEAGGVYVPLDPGHPEDRLRYILADSGARLLLTERGLAGAFGREGLPALVLDEGGWEEAGPAFGRGAGPEPESLAYVMYTSGSTGRPKGVGVSHGAVANFLAAMRRELAPGPGDVWVAVTTVAFDISVLELFLPLAVGARIELADRETAMDGQRLIETIEASGATFLQATPAGWQLLLDSGWQGREGLSILCGGEALPRTLAERLAGLGRAVWNLYGPTEATVWASFHRVLSGGDRIPVGRPIGGMEIRVLDEGLRPVPIGVAGEICLAGVGLARGYLGRPELTAERFVPDPWADQPGARLYRTGDLGHHRPDGEVEFLGRNDHQVKIRGFRIELREIEQVLRRYPGVRQAAAVASGEPPAGPRLVAYLVPAGGPVATEDLRRFVAARLPEYMVPAVFVELPELPLTPNGKVDRKALPAPGLASERREPTVPRTYVEQLLAGIWAQVLGVDRVGIEDDFFALGGHSLLATRVVVRVRKALGVEIPVRTLFEASTLEALARRVEKAWRHQGDDPLPPLVRAPRNGDLPLSFAQQRLWLLHQLDPQGVSYNLRIAMRLRGRLDVAALAGALSEVVRRHEALRTTFAEEDGRAVQVIHPPAPVPLPLLDLTVLPEAAASRAVPAAVDAVADRPFDLARGPLLAGALLRLGADEHLLLVSQHHIVSDGWSLQILMRELAALYGAAVQGLPSPLPELPFQYADWAVWQRSRLTGNVLERQLAYWRRQLVGAPAVLELPVDRPRPSSTSHRGAIHRFELPPATSRGLAALAGSQSATVFMVTLSAFEALLGGLSGQAGFVVGTPVAGRALQEVEDLIGMFVNTLALRADREADPPFVDLLARTRETCLEAHAHQDLPFERLVEELQPERSLGRTPIFQVLFGLQNVPSDGTVELPGLLFEPVRTDPKAVKLDLSLSLEERPDGTLGGSFEYSSELFDPTTILRLEGHFRSLLESVVADPSRRLSELLPLGPAERRELVSREALPKPERASAETVGAVLPRTTTEEVIAGFWRQILGIDLVGVHDDFFELGGHSLLANQLAARIRKAFRIELSLREVFAEPTVAGLAYRVDQAVHARDPHAAPAERVDFTEPPIRRLPRERPLPASFAQQSLWLIDQLMPGNAAYNMPLAVRLTGRLDPSAWQRSLNEVVARHESLRTLFALAQEELRQEITPYSPFPVPCVDLGTLRAPALDVEVRRLVLEQARQPFDLGRGPLLRTCLLRLSQTEHVAVLVMHHIVSDGWSMQVLFREVTAVYSALLAGLPSPLPELPVQYADFAAWQRERLQGPGLEAQVDYWKRRLAGAPSLLELPLDHPRPASQALRGANRSRLMSAAVVRSLEELGRGRRASLFMVSLAVFNVLLRRLTGRDDLIVGTDVANRGRVEVEPLIGFFVNQIPLRIALSGSWSFNGLLECVREVVLEAFQNQEVPFETLVNELRIARRLDAAPLFQVKLIMNNVPPGGGALPDLEAWPFELDLGASKLDLVVSLTPLPEGLRVVFNYDKNLFNAATIDGILEQFELLLRETSSHPELTIDELDRVLIQNQRRKSTMENMARRESMFSSLKAVKPKAIKTESGQLVTTGYLQEGQTLPLVVRPAVEDADLAEWAAANRDFIESELRRHGGILFRGFRIEAAEDFERFAGAVCDELFNENGEHPRESVSGNVYTPVFFSPRSKLLWHNENSFNLRWPRKIMFCALRPADVGGETPIVDSRKVFERIRPEIREEFLRKGVMYVRNYGLGVGLTWQTVFQTSDAAAAERHCAESEMEVTWKDGDRAKTTAVRAAAASHPVTKEMSWFNQAQHFHPACLEPETREAMEALFAEDDLPRHCHFGDGSPIPDEVMEEILAVYRELEVVFPWQKGDVVLLDNVLCAHARNPYEGERKLLVALGDMMSYQEIGD